MSGTSATTAVERAGTAPSMLRRRRAPLAWALAAVIASAALFACYLRQSRTVSVGSDGASQALQAWDLLHGNPLLHGWWVTDVSFYTTELPQYALIELARGLTADVIHVAGAMTYVLLVLTAALLARGRTGGGEGVTRALIAAGIMLAPQLGPGTQTLVLSPDHAGTSIPILLVFLLVDRAPAGWYVPVLLWLGLAWTALADAMTVFVAVIPLALVCAIRTWHGLARDREPFAAHRYEASLAVAAVLAVPAELAAAALIRAHGGWQVNGLSTGLAGAGQLAGNVRLAGEGLLELFGADVFGAAAGPGTALAAVHLAGLALAVGGVLAAARRLLRRDTRVEDGTLIESVLVTGIVIDLAAYLSGVQAVNILSTREIAPVLPFAAVLAGRCLALPCRARRCWLGAALTVYAAGLACAAVQPPTAPQYADLAVWLRAHHLTAGLSGYHQANIVTLETGGAVTLRPVTSGADGRVAAYAWNTSAAWYDPAAHAATFLVLADRGFASPAAPGVTAARAIATFGPPAMSYRYKEYEILVWRRGANLLADLRSTHPL
ncbi:MAG: hypothetical protein ACRDOI_38625 [Trebonia sp.]